MVTFYYIVVWEKINKFYYVFRMSSTSAGGDLIYSEGAASISQYGKDCCSDTMSEQYGMFCFLHHNTFLYFRYIFPLCD